LLPLPEVPPPANRLVDVLQGQNRECLESGDIVLRGEGTEVLSLQAVGRTQHLVIRGEVDETEPTPDGGVDERNRTIRRVHRPYEVDV